MTEQPLGSAYVVGERLGGGAMGAVHSGRDRDGRAYAFKLLRPDLAEEPELVQRFMQERSALTGVDHPNVVKMHDLVVEGSTLAIVMDLVPGADLRALVRERHTLPPAEVARLGAGIASGLAAVHRAGLVHRDVKPENVLLDTSVQPPIPRVTDFGIARIADASTRTRSSMMVGTPNYLAPEVADGHTPTPAVDVYGLGIVLYELCSGITPFEGGSYLAVIKRHATSPPGRPDGIPDELWAAIEDMLAKDPAQRPSAAQVVPYLTALTDQLQGMPAAPALDEPPGTGEVTEQVTQPETARGQGSSAVAAEVPPAPRRRRRSVVPALIGLGLTLVVAAVAVWWFVLRDADVDTGDAQQVALTAEASPSAQEPAATQSPATPAAAAPTPSGQAPTTEASSAQETPSAVPSTMPDVVGQTLSEARAQLRGTRVDVIEDFDEGAKDNEVLAQATAAGDPLPDEVELTVARQPVTRYLEALESVSSDGFSQAAAQVDGENYPRSLVAGGWYSSEANMSWNLSRGYRQLRGTVGRSDGAENTETEVQVEFFLDERKVHTETVGFGEAVELSVDVADALRLQIVATSLDGESMDIVLGDIRLLGLPGEVPELEE